MRNPTSTSISKLATKSKFANARGSSLIEAVFATVIISIVGLGVLEVALFSGAATRRAIVVESLEDRIKEVRQVVYSDEGCLATVQANIPGGDLRTVTTFPISAIEAVDLNAATRKRTIASINEFVGEDWSKVTGSLGYRLAAMQVTVISRLPNDNYLLNLALTFDENPSPTTPKIVRNIPMQVAVAPATGTVAKCFSTDEGRASCLTQGYSWNPTLKVCIVPPVTALGKNCPTGQTMVGIDSGGNPMCRSSCTGPVSPPPPGSCSAVGATLLPGGTCCSRCEVRLGDGSLVCTDASACPVFNPSPTPVACRPVNDMLDTACAAGGYAPDNNQANALCCSGMARWHAYADAACGTGYGYELTCIPTPTPEPTAAPSVCYVRCTWSNWNNNLGICHTVSTSTTCETTDCIQQACPDTGTACNMAGPTESGSTVSARSGVASCP
jgi:hypothetical protein